MPIERQMNDDLPWDDWGEPPQSIEAFLIGLDETLRGAYCLDSSTKRGCDIQHQRERFHTRLTLELRLFLLQKNADVVRWQAMCTSLLGDREILKKFDPSDVTI